LITHSKVSRRKELGIFDSLPYFFSSFSELHALFLEITHLSVARLVEEFNFSEEQQKNNPAKLWDVILFYFS